jgi:hypothetical protein
MDCPQCGLKLYIHSTEERRKEEPLAAGLNHLPVRFRKCARGHRIKTFEVSELELGTLRRDAYIGRQTEAWYKFGMPKLPPFIKKHLKKAETV